MLQKLGSRGLVIYAPCEPVILTPEGRCAAGVIRERHRVLQALLRHVGVPERAVREEACVLEQALRDETIERIREFVERESSEKLVQPNPLRQGFIRV